MVLPSVRARMEASSPKRHSSISTVAPLAPKAPPKQSSTKALALPAASATSTPFPAARPSALTTIPSAPAANSLLIYSLAAAASVKVAERAVGILYLFMNCLAKSLLPSRRAPSALGPKTRRPAARSLSATPAHRGASGPTTAKAISLVLANSASLSPSSTPILTHSATSAIPALPGAQYNFSVNGDCRSFQQRACSRPPEPITRIFIIFLLMKFHFKFSVSALQNR